jgi:hypothetical protein
MDTTSVVYTEWGTTIARYCHRTKRWYRYHDGNYLKGTVELFAPIDYATWQSIEKFNGEELSIHLVQTVNGRYTLAYFDGAYWICLSNKRILREKVAQQVLVSNMREGTWKSILPAT